MPGKRPNTFTWRVLAPVGGIPEPQRLTDRAADIKFLTVIDIISALKVCVSFSIPAPAPIGHGYWRKQSRVLNLFPPIF
jgi:hypothetical protein